MKNIIIINSYANTEEKVNLLLNYVKQVKKTNCDILLTSHLPLPPNIVALVNYYIYDKETLYYAKDSTKEELSEFVESLQTKDLQKFKEFFDTTPKLRKNINFKCPKCSYEEDVLVEGIESFFV
jgi:hypothetical protein